MSDLVNAKWSDFKTIQDNWWFEVIGKGGKHALLPVAAKLLDEIKWFREFSGLGLYPSPEDDFAVIPSWRGGESLSARQINYVLKSLALATLQKIKPEHDDVGKFTTFSAHKIRHIMGSDLARANLSADIRKQLMRHSKIETTLEYSQLEKNILLDGIDKLDIIR